MKQKQILFVTLINEKKLAEIFLRIVNNVKEKHTLFSSNAALDILR